MIDKNIHRYSNVRLLDTIKNSLNKTDIKKSKVELESRKLTNEQKNELEKDYAKYKEFQNKRKNEPLTNEEWLSYFILPFFTPKPRWRNDHYTESESERFDKYGYTKKAEQAEKVKIFGIIFWLSTIVIVGIILKYWQK